MLFNLKRRGFVKNGYLGSQKAVFNFIDLVSIIQHDSTHNLKLT